MRLSRREDRDPLHCAAAWGRAAPCCRAACRARGPTLKAIHDDYKVTAAGWADHFGYKDVEAFLLGAVKTMGA